MCDFSYTIPHITFAEFLLHVLALSSTGLEVLVPRENVSIRRQNNGPVELENKIVTWLFEGVMSLNQQEEKKCYSTGWLPRGNWLATMHGGKEYYV